MLGNYSGISRKSRKSEFLVVCKKLCMGGCIIKEIRHYGFHHVIESVPTYDVMIMKNGRDHYEVAKSMERYCFC